MKKWSEKDKEKVQILFLRDGKSRNDIAKELKITSSAVDGVIKREGWARLKPKTGKKQKSLKEEFIEKATKADIRKLVTKRTLYDVVGESILNATKALPVGKIPSVILQASKKPEDEEEMFTLFGDVHGGAYVDARESGGLGSYNTDILAEELEFFRLSQAKIFKIHRNNTPYNVHNIFMLGDIIENLIMRESQMRLSEGSVVDQVMFAVDKIAIWIGWLASQFSQINVFCVVGNHGRLTQKIGVLAPRDSFDYLIYKWLAERLRNHKNVKFNISESWWMGIERMGVKFYIEHGEEFMSWLGIPFYGLKRGKANVRELLRQYLDEKGRRVDFDYFVVGHNHTPAEFQGIIVNGSFVGGTEYSFKRLKAGEPATQKMFSIHPTFKKTWSRDLLLKHPADQSTIKFYS